MVQTTSLISACFYAKYHIFVKGFETFFIYFYSKLYFGFDFWHHKNTYVKRIFC